MLAIVNNQQARHRTQCSDNGVEHTFDSSFLKVQCRRNGAGNAVILGHWREFHE
jgi:hypothetical protein